MRRPSLLVHIGLMILASVIIVVLALVWMNLFTRHGSSVEIPNIYGLPASEAVRLLDLSLIHISLSWVKWLVQVASLW